VVSREFVDELVVRATMKLSSFSSSANAPDPDPDPDPDPESAD